MRFDIVTIFPRLIEGLLREGILARTVARGLVDVRVFDLREATDDRHRVVDDAPFGGGPGMVLKPEPMFRAVERLRAERGEASAVILLSPQGARFRQRDAERLSRLEHLILLCGRYEGVDERVRQGLATEELSVGDYVLSGGELAALVVLDAVARLIPGAVDGVGSVEQDSFSGGLLDYPHYTRPSEFRGMTVPGVLLSGHHAAIDAWRRRAALRRTLERRPDLLEEATLDARDRATLRELVEERERREHSDERD